MMLARPVRSSANASGAETRIRAAIVAIAVLIMLPPRGPPCLRSVRVGIRQRPLQLASFVLWRAHPHVVFLRSRQDHRHCFGMYRFDDDVRRRCQEGVDQVRPGDRLGFRAAIRL